MKILIFTEGTILMPSSAVNLSRKERVKQSASQSNDVKNFRNYIPNGNAVSKIKNWKNQGAEIYYLTSSVTTEKIDDIRYVLKQNNFPDSQNLLFRKNDEAYKDVSEHLMPDIFIEDDCESIGGEPEMTYPHIKPELQKNIHSIIVKEFEGINDLPDLIAELLSYGKKTYKKNNS